MRVLHVATLVTPTNEFGGPIQVALNQVNAITSLGHDAILTAGCRHFDGTPPNEFVRAHVSLFPAHKVLPFTGYAGLTCIRMLRWMQRNLHTFDLVHVHLARDLVTLPAAMLSILKGSPTVVQTHGMIDRSSHLLARPLDLTMTRHVLQRADRALILTSEERARLIDIGFDARFVELPNGVTGHPVTELPRQREVLFLARLHERKRPLHFVRAAIALREHFPDVTWTIVGPDAGEGCKIDALLSEYGSQQIIREPALHPSKVLDRMARAQIYCLPAFDEPFGMTLIEAMSAGTAVIVTNSSALSPVILRHAAGLCVDDSLPALIEGMNRLLSDEQLRGQIAQNGTALVAAEFEMKTIAERLVAIYEDAVNNRHTGCSSPEEHE